ncbi:glycine zipper family protein [Allochromatium humboldtianum]|uniref:Glycine zipper family protein n=1 Tax=Allochromatium humboldtianum TaxID=504901 RepID=A0A850RRK1_9GAMM|nr:glycine zipper family protein [Allochromatium humboldtianum]NVZ11533.1 glycine zipper family protein [Allochromatium humboldtianum]
MPQSPFLWGSILGVLALTGCATNEARLYHPRQTATILEVIEWDTCLGAPGAQTRPQRAARSAKHQASSHVTFGEMPVSSGTPEQDGAALGGIVQGASLGALAGSGPDDIVVGAVAGAIGGILLATQDVEECYRHNRLSLRVDSTGEILTAVVQKQRNPSIDQGKYSPQYAFVAGAQGSEGFRVGESVNVIRVTLPTVDKHVAVVPLTDADCSRYPLCSQPL